MWFVLKCNPGKSEEIMESCREHISGQVLHDIFTFTYDRMKRYEGNWHTESSPMFPDCIFLETADPAALSEQLELYGASIKRQGDGSLLVKVTPEEEAFLKRLGGQEHHLKMSQGYIKNGITHIVTGPLVGMERRIRKIDRHKRLANIEMPMQGMEKPVQAGLEITSKS